MSGLHFFVRRRARQLLDSRPASGEHGLMADREQSGLNRRGFLLRLGLGSLGLAVTAFATGLSAVLWPRKGRQRWVEVGRPRDFVPGSWRKQDGQDFYLVMSAQGLAAISSTCTHLGCTLRHSGEGFVCPCHGGRFAADGQVVQGPPDRELPWFKIIVDAGRVFVDPGQQVTAQSYTPMEPGLG